MRKVNQLHSMNLRPRLLIFILDIFIAFMIGPERIGPSLLLLELLRRYGPRVYQRGTFRGAKA